MTNYTDQSATSSLPLEAETIAYAADMAVAGAPLNTSEKTAFDKVVKQLKVDDTGGTILPTQSGNNGKFLSTNGTALAWAAPAASSSASVSQLVNGTHSVDITAAGDLSLNSATGYLKGVGTFSQLLLNDGNGSIIMYGANVAGTGPSGFFTVTSSGSTLQLINGLLRSNVPILAGSSGSADPSAVLQADSPSQGFLPPRLTTTQRNAISSPAEGLIIYNISTHTLNYFNGTTWISL